MIWAKEKKKETLQYTEIKTIETPRSTTFLAS